MKVTRELCNRLFNLTPFPISEEVEKVCLSHMELEAELATLRPPEPKFNVGQVVMRLPANNSFTVRARRLQDRTWEYTNYREDASRYAYTTPTAPQRYLERGTERSWTPEDQLRKLTIEEIG